MQYLLETAMVVDDHYSGIAAAFTLTGSTTPSIASNAAWQQAWRDKMAELYPSWAPESFIMDMSWAQITATR